MAKILKLFGQKKTPPQPPRPDYAGDRFKNLQFADHHYANIGSFSSTNSSVSFEETLEENKLMVFEDYSEPADLRAEIAALQEEEYDPLYMAPVDQMIETAAEDELYCVPYENSEVPTLPSPCTNTVGSSFRGDSRADSLSDSDGYDTVPDLSHDFDEDHSPSAPRASPSETASSTVQCQPNEEYDEPWEWNITSRLGQATSPSSPGNVPLGAKADEEPTYSEPPVSPQPAESIPSDSESCCEGSNMTTRQRRLYETAFDSRVKRDIDDIDRLMQSPVLQGDLYRPRINPGESGPVLRTVSRSSFGSTSGSSTSSTPTHQPQLVSKPSPRPRHYPLHLTPTERRKVSLIRDHLPARSSSPMSRPIKVISGVDPLQKFNNRNARQQDSLLITNFERQISLNSRWDSASRCSDKSSSSQESMDQKDDFAILSNPEPKLYPLGKSASRDSIAAYRDVVLPNRNLNNHLSDFSKLRSGTNKNFLDSSSKDEHLDENSTFVLKKQMSGHTGVKVLSTDNGLIVTPNKTSSTNSSISSSSHVLNSTELSTSSTTSQIDNDVRPKPDRPMMSNRIVPDSSCSSSSSLSTLQAQSPENDDRPSDDYDPPWEFKPRSSGVNGSQSVPEFLSRKLEDHAGSFDGTDRIEEPSSDNATDSPSTSAATAPPLSLPKPMKPFGLSARPNLNLNLNLNSDSPRKARQNLILNFGCAALSAVGEKVDAALTLEKQGWYHGSISRHDAENLLRVLKEGSYLVRNSESSKQDYSLSLRSARGFMHMKIVHSDGRFILGQFSNPFPSIPEMIHHYSINKLPIKGAEHMSLLYPVIDQLL